MHEHNIFPITVDLDNKVVYIRPILGKKPGYKTLSTIKNWAIEKGYGEDIRIDYALAEIKQLYKRTI